jgi:hypothetical protein
MELKSLFDCNDQLAPVWLRVIRPDDPLIDVNRAAVGSISSSSSATKSSSGRGVRFHAVISLHLALNDNTRGFRLMPAGRSKPR